MKTCRLRVAWVVRVALLACLAIGWSLPADAAEREGYSIIGQVVTLDANLLEGVTIHVSGGMPDSVTDREGNYTVSVRGDVAKYTVTPQKEGYAFSPAAATVWISCADGEANFLARAVLAVANGYRANRDGQRAGPGKDHLTAQQRKANPEMLMLQPTILSVNPAFPAATGSAQPFTINGSNFQSGCTVTLRDLSLGTTYPNRTISSQTSTQLVITPSFGTRVDLWSVEVINSGTSSGQFIFPVVAPPPPQPSRQGVDCASSVARPSELKAAGYDF
ncbi:MAG: hypothetical protein FJ290_21455, partial [Planctomycetes bacterium]|nr:hypothetical protein [Planctomycetota bacterium]